MVPIPSKVDCETLRAHHKTLTQIKRELLASQQKVSSLQELSTQLLVNTRPPSLPQALGSEQLQAEGSECLEAQEKVHVISNRRQLLLREVSNDLDELERRLERADPQQEVLPLPLGKVETCESDDVVSEMIHHRRLTPRGKSSQTQPGHPESRPRHSRGRSPDAVGCVSSHSDLPDTAFSSSSSSPKGQSLLLRVLRVALPIQLLLLLLIGLACLVPMTEQDYSCHHANNFARSFHPMLRYTNGPPPI